MTEFSVRIPAEEIVLLAARLNRGHAIPGDRWRKMRLPPEAVHYALDSGTTHVVVSLTDSGRSCGIRAGSRELEFDAVVDVAAEAEHAGLEAGAVVPAVE